VGPTHPNDPLDDELIDRLTAALTQKDDAVPEPGADFERVMWARVRKETTRRPQWTWRVLAPAAALAASVLVAIAIGHQLSATTPAPDTKVASADVTTTAADGPADRVLLTALDEHLEQTEALLVELRNSTKGEDLRRERLTADDLVSAGRLYRQSAEFAGRPGVVRVLDDLEPVLVELARSSDQLDDQQREWLRSRITDDNLLFKVRAMSTDLRVEVK
jgi:hypothetical protein